MVSPARSFRRLESESTLTVDESTPASEAIAWTIAASSCAASLALSPSTVIVPVNSSGLVGDTVGTRVVVGIRDGGSVGVPVVGHRVGPCVGSILGHELGCGLVGLKVGGVDGVLVGRADGIDVVGLDVGRVDGVYVGRADGLAVGVYVGTDDGIGEGQSEGE